MKQHKWTEEKLAALTQLFPIESTKHTAAILQMSMTAVKRKAKELGLQKEAKSSWAERAEYVRSHFQHSSLSEMAKKLDISRTTVMRIIERLGFTRTKEQTFQVRSRIRTEIIRRERRHVLFGLAPVTRIKVVSNRARIQLRAKLKSIGYIVSRASNTLYYTEDMERRCNLEDSGIKLGLHFLPFPGEEALVLTAI
ncbi:MarR family transcriptional regulator [Bacteroides sp. KG68]|uniref:MarR family transcriptional regulator n=1 Tax=unclassified Bacteroides TaxID=2646097 RepID=UPI003D971721